MDPPLDEPSLMYKNRLVAQDSLQRQISVRQTKDFIESHLSNLSEMVHLHCPRSTPRPMKCAQKLKEICISLSLGSASRPRSRSRSRPV